MTKRISIIGCGNIGSRHLQAISKLNQSLIIDVVEPDDNAKTVAKLRLNEMNLNMNNHEFNWYSNLNELNGASDLVIIATTSNGRAKLIEKLLEKGHSRFLIEKIVCQSDDEYQELLSHMRSFNAKGWVNTPRRYFKSYQKIMHALSDSNFYNLSVIAGNEGLGSNAIHFIDIFSWLTNDYKLKLTGEFLKNELLSNKRGGKFLEFVGTIAGTTQNGSHLSITFLPSDNMPLTVDLSGDNKRIIVNETDQAIIHTNNIKDVDLEFHTEYQSNISLDVANDVLTSDNCLLPTLENSFHVHSELFRIFNLHVEKILKQKNLLCPIT